MGRPAPVCAAVLFLSTAVTLFALPAYAHKPSDSYLTLTVSGARIGGRWDVALRDLDNVIDLDADGDGDVTWRELRAQEGRVASLASSHLSLAADGAGCPLSFRGMEVATHSDGNYAVLDFDAACPDTPRTLGVNYFLGASGFRVARITGVAEGRRNGREWRRGSCRSCESRTLAS